MSDARTWYNLAASADSADDLDVYIYDAIGGYDFADDKWVTAKQFIRDLAAAGSPRHINLHVNSPGGSIVEGNAIYNALRRHPASITVHIDGLAASMASVVAMVGDEIRMAANAMMMIHEPWTFAMGRASELRKAADLLDKFETGIVRAYADRTGQLPDSISEWMRDETWMDADEAVALGFADTIDGAMPAAARYTIPDGLCRTIPPAVLTLMEATDVPRHPTAPEPGHADPPDLPPTTPEGKGTRMSPITRILGLFGVQTPDGETDEAAAARLERLTNRFADEAFVREQFQSGNDVTEAYATMVDRLEASLAERDARIAEMETDAAEATAAAESAQAELTAANEKVATLTAALADAMDREPITVAPGDEPGSRSDAFDADRCRAEFAAKPDLQAEFRTAGAYVAFRKADSEGRVRRVTKTAASE